MGFVMNWCISVEVDGTFVKPMMSDEELSTTDNVLVGIQICGFLVLRSSVVPVS